MEVGQKLSIIAGIMTLVATYIFSWFAINIGGNVYYANGIGIIRNIPAMFTDAESIADTLEINLVVFYIIAVLFVLFLVAGVFQILGVKHRAFVIIGTILSLGLAVLLLLSSVEVIDIANWVYYMIGTDQILVDNVIPITVFGLDMFDVGLYILYAAGFIGIIASVYGPELF